MILFCLEEKVPQGHLATILIVVLGGLDRKAEAIFAASLGAFLEPTLVEHFLADANRKLHVSHEEQLPYMPLVRLLPRHKAVPNMLNKLPKLYLLQPFDHPSRLPDSLVGLLHSQILFVLKHVPFDQVPVLKLLFVDELVLSPLFHH